METEEILKTATLRPWRAESQPDIAPAKVFGPRHPDGGDYAALFESYDHANIHLVAIAVNSYEKQRECIAELSRALTELMECNANGSPLPVLTKAMIFSASVLACAKELL